MNVRDRIGLYGGSFDPIHVGHLAVAEDARVALGLSRVLVVPAARQPLKPLGQGAPAADRLAMVRLACADNPAFVADPVELERPPPSYTIDTVEALRTRFDEQVELWLILGADAARDLPQWHRAAELLALVQLAVVERPGVRVDFPALESALPALRGRYRRVEGPGLDISSTVLRRRVAEGRPIRYQTPDPVRAYIETNKLYVDTNTSGTSAR